MKILIVDDSRAMRLLIRAALRKTRIGDHFEEAENGREALEKARRDRPDLIVSDWNMPEMNGLELLEQLRAESIDTPFAILTTEPDGNRIDRARAAGALFVLSKPCTPVQLQEALVAAGFSPGSPPN